MRADRLLSILMHLQTRGRTTTDRLAETFEVSRRTILRDLYALRVAGFPITTVSGPGGGCFLPETFRNTLTQLTHDEMSALLLLTLQQPLMELGWAGPLRAARLKLAAATTDVNRAATERMRQRLVIDSVPWARHSRSTDCLAGLHQATMQDRWVRAVFARPFGVMTERRIAPHGLVAKAGGWFLVWAGEDGDVRIDRIDRIRAMEVEEEHFDRAASFDLAAYWNAWRERQEATRPGYEVCVRVRESALDYVRDVFGERRGVIPRRARDQDRWIEMNLTFLMPEEARRKLLALGGAVEVIRPEALRVSMADYARQIALRYLDAGGSPEQTTREVATPPKCAE